MEFIYFTREKDGVQHERILNVEEISDAHFVIMPDDHKDENQLTITMKNGTDLRFIDKNARRVWVHLRTLGDKI